MAQTKRLSPCKHARRRLITTWMDDELSGNTTWGRMSISFNVLGYLLNMKGGGWEYIRRPLSQEESVIKRPQKQYALIGTAGVGPERVCSPAAGSRESEEWRWSLPRSRAASFCAGATDRVSPADLHDAPLQELPIELVQAFGYFGAESHAACGHRAERDG